MASQKILKVFWTDHAANEQVLERKLKERINSHYQIQKISTSGMYYLVKNMNF